MKRELEPRVKAYLYDLLESARIIQEYCHGVDKEAFFKTALLQDAVCMRLAVMGELAGKLEKPIKGLPLKSMKGLRNRIAHDYGRVDLNIVWKVAVEEIDPIVSKLDELLED